MLLRKQYCSFFFIFALLPFTPSQATECREFEAFKVAINQQDSRGALQELDQCLASSEHPSAEDLQTFNDLLKVLLNQYQLSSEEAYRNFQSVLSIHLLKELKFELADFFDTHPQEDKKLFSEVRPAEEKYRFYYDDGRLLSYARGIALTDKSLIWKNLTGPAQVLAFNAIKNLKLVYERGLSLTGWELRINDTSDIRLSQIPEVALIPLISAMIYFINTHKDPTLEKLALEVPEKEMAILAGWITLCHKKYVDHHDTIKNLQHLDQCFMTYDKDFQVSSADKELLSTLIQKVLVQGTSLETAYENFKVVLSTSPFRELKFKFKEELQKNDLFKEVIAPTETLYFYFDSGTVSSGNRGLALTHQSIVWKNLLATSINLKNITGSSMSMPFDKISSVALVYETHLAAPLGEWKLRLNNDQDIILPKLSTENVEIFASALVYFFNSTLSNKLTLQITDSAKEILNKSFLDRHPKMKSFTDSVLDIFKP